MSANVPPFRRRVVVRRGQPYTVADTYPDHAGDGTTLDWDFWSVFADASWEPELEEVLRAHLRHGRGLVDIGAWVGPVTIIGARMAAWVYAVDPDPVAYALHGANRRLNGAANVSASRRAVRGVDPQPLALVSPDGGRFGDSMTRTRPAAIVSRALTVPAWTMRQLFDRLGVTNAGLVKIDIEGAEEQVLPEAAPFLRAVGVPLLLSLHGPMADDPTRYADRIDTALRGWTFEVLTGQRDGWCTALVTP